MNPDLKFIETIDRLIRNIPAACTLLVEEGHANLAGQLEGRVNLAGQLERDQRNLMLWREQLGDPEQTVACIPSSVIGDIHDMLLEIANVEVPYYSDNPLKMAQTAFKQQKTGISQVLDLIIQHCFHLPAEPEEPEP